MTTTLEHPAGPPSHIPRFAGLRAVSRRHWFREVAVIAAGALAALAAQAWWQDRQDSERERDYLRYLLADTRENARRVDDAVTDDSLAALHQKQLANALYGAGTLPPADTLMRFVVGGHGALSASDFKPLGGTYAALQSSGDLRLIRDERLRTAIVVHAARLDNERELSRLFYQQAFGDISRVTRALPFMRRGLSNPDAMFDEARHFPFEHLRHSPEFDALLFALQAANNNRLAHLRGLRDDTRRLLTILDAPRAASSEPPARDTAASRHAK